MSSLRSQGEAAKLSVHQASSIPASAEEGEYEEEEEQQGRNGVTEFTSASAETEGHLEGTGARSDSKLLEP
jgi:hypothetical protein